MHAAWLLLAWVLAPARAQELRPALPPNAEVDDAVPDVYRLTVSHVRDRHLDRDTLDAGVLFRSAARQLERAVPWLLVDEAPDRVSLWHGGGRSLGDVPTPTWDTLAARLFELEDRVRAAGYPFDDIDLRFQVLDGMTRALDPYTRLLTGEMLTRFDARLRGTLVGVGATLARADGGLEVIGVSAGGPAEAADLRPGDRLLRIDGTSTTTMPVREAVRRIRGEAGTTVRLVVARDDAPEREVALVSATVVLPNVTHEVLEGGVARVHISHISQTTVFNLRSAFTALIEAGALRRGLVLDLRGNTGGSLRESAAVVDELVRGGVIVTTSGPDGGPVAGLPNRLLATDDGVEPPVPVVVGRTTFGKGEVQKLYSVEDDARLKITVAEYVVADGLKVRGGLAPDVEVGRWRLDARGIHHDAGGSGGVGPRVAEVRASGPWHDEAEDVDVVQEIARRAILAAAAPARDAVLAAARVAAVEVGAREAARLDALLQRSGLDWRPAPTALQAVGGVRASVGVVADPEEPGGVVVEARVAHDGPGALHRAWVHVDEAGFGPWEGLRIPVGYVPAGGEVVGRVRVSLPPGIGPRDDAAAVRVTAAGRRPLPTADAVLHVATPALPQLSLTAALQREDARDPTLATLALTVDHVAGAALTGLEVELRWEDIDGVEVIDAGHRVGELPPRARAGFGLRLRVAKDAPPTLPLRIRFRDDDAGGLGTWRLDVPSDGTPVRAAAPAITIAGVATAWQPGPLTVPVGVRDDSRVDEVVVWFNGDKVLWQAGTGPRADLRLRLDVQPGGNTLQVRAVDDQGLTTWTTWRVLGLGGRDDEPGLVVADDDDE